MEKKLLVIGIIALVVITVGAILIFDSGPGSYSVVSITTTLQSTTTILTTTTSTTTTSTVTTTTTTTTSLTTTTTTTLKGTTTTLPKFSDGGHASHHQN